MNVPVLVGAAYGFGRDIWGMTPDQITSSLHWLWVAYPLYMTTEAFCQLSILAFYLRIMTDKKQRLIVWGLMGFVAAFGLANFFTMVFQCWPINYFWDGWKREMTVDAQINMNLFSFIRGGLEIALDLVILALPLPMLAKLQMSRKKKMQIMSMFCVGFVITGVSCARLHALIQFAATTNPTYDNTSGIYWCMIEANLFIIVACMPAIHAVLHKAWRNGTSRNASGKASYINNTSDNRRQKSGSLPSGVISKSTDVKVYHTNRSNRSESDVELVDQGDGPGQIGSDDGKSISRF
ncbi:hypothetical protein K491DRAFT_705300 [Lophiostoma macrostomum CBS 122681]|uniref:Rhodopsin domain-containing protein n=1 Tax=Lophiostoma macrostomum CBS 122681 TaxID=1314788 RepID=A0A6A6T2I9_9PLEO|nr:hypothetical protein K491DRAFT_705300 [Lophiostoma macrostomum CBS 122681]